MQRNEYSAGAVKLSFWFSEFRKVVSLIRSGKTIDEIKTIADTENIFSAVSPMRSKQIFNTISARVKSLTPDFYELFVVSGLDDQRIITLIAIMNTDALFLSFMNEVFREKLITGDTVLTNADIRIFFHNKQRESAKVAGWRDDTLNNLAKTYKVYLAEAGLIGRGSGYRKINKPLLDRQLYNLLSERDTQILKILTGMG